MGDCYGDMVLSGVEIDLAYAALIDRCMTSGQEITTRNSRVRRLTGVNLVFSSCPLIGVRKTAWKTCIREMEFFLSGSTNINTAHPSVRPWWDPWATAGGHIRGHYGERMRTIGVDGFDQLAYLTGGVSGHPYSRRNTISLWDASVAADPDVKITTCHGSLIHAAGNADGTLDLVMVQRSADVVCGVPHNWMQYWAFLLWLSHKAGRRPGFFHWYGVDVHVYEQHFDLAERIVRRSAGVSSASPQLIYTPTSDDLKADDFTLDGPYSPLIDERAEMVV